MKFALLAGVSILAACGTSAETESTPSPQPTNAYVEWSDGAPSLYFEVTTQATLADFLKTSGDTKARQLEALPAGAEIACHKTAHDGSAFTIWDDGSPASKTFGQEACNRLK